jgi:hypothetical protein
MSPRMLLFSQVIEQEKRRWMPFRHALSKEDQAAFDRVFACVTQQRQSEVLLGRPWRFEAVIMAVLLSRETARAHPKALSSPPYGKTAVSGEAVGWRAMR